MYRKIEKCRICGNTSLVRVLDLGKQMLTGVFPKARTENVTSGPLSLVKCTGDQNVCGLLQLEHSFDAAEMYGVNYGYRSGLNPSMVEHLHAKVARIQRQIRLQAGDLVVDIGSNDSTTLQAYPADLELVGIDPTGSKFFAYYPPSIKLIPSFFSAQILKNQYGDRKAKVVTSFSMFYDLESPMDFMREVHEILADDGIWVFEQSYMPMMLETNSYDTVCHEHLEFYGLSQIQWMASRLGFQILDVEFNEINGGSFSVTMGKCTEAADITPLVREILERERALRLDTLAPYQEFAQRVELSRKSLREFIQQALLDGKSVAALGASTKGNVLLQYCGFTPEQIHCIGEVNPEKFGCYTPGTYIPIIPEEQLLDRKPDYLIVLPWHFRNFFLNNPKFLNTYLVFPLPDLSLERPRFPHSADRQQDRTG